MRKNSNTASALALSAVILLFATVDSFAGCGPWQIKEERIGQCQYSLSYCWGNGRALVRVYQIRQCNPGPHQIQQLGMQQKCGVCR